MKRFLMYILLFFSILVLMAAAVAIIGRFDNLNAAFSDNGNIKRIQQKSNFDKLDILFIGNSYCYSGINPEFFDSLDVNTYNLGIPTAGPYIYELVVNDYLKEVKHLPKKILFLISPMTFSSKADNFPAYPIHRYLSEPLSNEGLVLKYGIIDQYVNLSKKSFEKGIENLRAGVITTAEIIPVERKGYSPSYAIVNDSIVMSSENLYLSLAKDKLDEHYIKHLFNLCSEFREKNIQVNFFELPTNKLSNYFSDEYLRNYESLLDSVKQKYQLFRIQPELTDYHYRNIDHLNANGANVCTPELIQQMGLK